MKKSNLIACFLFFVCMVVYVSGCTRSSPTSTGTGSLTGNVQLSDSVGYPLNSSAGVTAIIEGTSLTAQTDSAGNWTIDGIPPGTHILRESKPGFGYTKDYNVIVAGPGIQYLNTDYLSSPPRFPLFLFSPTKINDSTIEFDANCPVTLNHDGYVGMFISLDSNFAIDSPSDVPIVFGDVIGAGTSNVIFQNGFDTYSFHYYGFSSGSKVYIVYFPVVGGRGSVYYDDSTGRNVYTSIGPFSNIVSTIVP